MHVRYRPHNHVTIIIYRLTRYSIKAQGLWKVQVNFTSQAKSGFVHPVIEAKLGPAEGEDARYLTPSPAIGMQN